MLVEVMDKLGKGIQDLKGHEIMALFYKNYSC